MYYLVFTEAAKIVFEICLAIEFLHNHDIAHRDLKVSDVHSIGSYVTFLMMLLTHSILAQVWVSDVAVMHRTGDCRVAGLMPTWCTAR